MAGAVFVNPTSGPDETDPSALDAAFPDGVVKTCDPDALATCIEQAQREGATYIAVAGGDGTVRGAVGALQLGEVPMVPVPTGTRNHFARQLGIETIEDAGRASCAGVLHRVDVGEVNGRWFVNNSSIGMYPKVVVRREAHEHRLPRGLAQVVAVWEQVRHGHRFRVAVDGDWCRAWMVFVGNGRYGRGLLDLSDRRSLDEQVLDVRVVRADAPLARTRIVAALLLGRLHRSPLLVQRFVPEVRIDVEATAVEVALDGEVESLSAPLVYRSHSGALAVLAPAQPGNDESGDSRGRKMVSR